MFAWIQMSPDVCMNEIEMAMVKIGAQDKYFKFESLTPLYKI